MIGGRVPQTEVWGFIMPSLRDSGDTEHRTPNTEHRNPKSEYRTPDTTPHTYAIHESPMPAYAKDLSFFICQLSFVILVGKSLR